MKGRHTFKAGVVIEYSGEDDFDQINVNAMPGGTNNQNGRFEFLDNRAGGTGLAVANVGDGSVQQLRRDRPARLHAVARARDRRLRAGLVEADEQPDHRRRHPLGDSGRRGTRRPTTSRTSIRSSTTRRRAPIIDPATGRIIGGNRYNGIVLPGNGFNGDGTSLVVASDPAVLALFRGQPAASRRRTTTCSSRGWASRTRSTTRRSLRASAGVFHNRVTLNDSTLLGGNPPFQPQVSVSNGSVDNPGAGGAASLPFAMTAQDVVFKHPTAYIVGDRRPARGARAASSST